MDSFLFYTYQLPKELILPVVFLSCFYSVFIDVVLCFIFLFLYFSAALELKWTTAHGSPAGQHEPLTSSGAPGMVLAC